MVDLAEMTPQFEELPFECCLMIVGEVTEELPENALLLVGEIVDTIQLMQVAQVGKHLIGIGHVLVYIIEIGQQQLSPAIEMVERLLDTSALDETLVELANELHRVAYHQIRLLTVQVADGDIRRTP